MQKAFFEGEIKADLIYHKTKIMGASYFSTLQVHLK